MELPDYLKGKPETKTVVPENVQTLLASGENPKSIE
jgi:hypothetical protein